MSDVLEGGTPRYRTDRVDGDHGTRSSRVERFGTDHAWAEDPPSLTGRLVTNVVPVQASEDEMEVLDYRHLWRAPRDPTDHDLLVGGRTDPIRELDGEPRLGRRWICLDQTTRSTDGLAVFP